MTDPFLLTGCLRLPVRDAAGTVLGRVADVWVEGSEQFPRVVALSISRAGAETSVPWRVITHVGTDAVLIHAPDAKRSAPSDDRILRLGRDVLDAQVVDLAGRRLARVGDVELAERDGALRAVAVDVGLAPVVRRLGLRRIAGRMREEWIGWDGIYLGSGRGHRLQLEHRAEDVHRLDHGDLMALVARLPPTRGAEVLDVARPGVHPDPVAAARRVRPPRRWFRVMRARKRAPS